MKPSPQHVFSPSLLLVWFFLPVLVSATTAAQNQPVACRQRFITHRIELPGCVEKRLLSKACRGSCESYSQYDPELNRIESVCNCCQAEGKMMRRIPVMCHNEANPDEMETRIVHVMLPTGCMCRPCASTAGKVPDVINEMPVEGALSSLSAGDQTALL